jgi:hypothetical protein
VVSKILASSIVSKSIFLSYVNIVGKVSDIVCSQFNSSIGSMATFDFAFSKAIIRRNTSSKGFIRLSFQVVRFHLD